ncbi:MAG TPA: hypothetical protein VNS58_12840 [Puia sp.]|nr:hypothetical protein [Puia sp.]
MKSKILIAFGALALAIAGSAAVKANKKFATATKIYRVDGTTILMSGTSSHLTTIGTSKNFWVVIGSAAKETVYNDASHNVPLYFK